MPLLSVEKRRTTFEEVALGYSVEDAINEAKRCLNCKNAPCRSGCPVGIDIPAFISRVAEGDFEGAYEIIERDNCLSAVSGRVCPQERQCEGKCVRGIKGESVGIGRLERFVSDYMRAKKSLQKVKSNGKRIAVIGTGPAGLSCASDLAKMGYKVTVFEALHLAGGVLIYGIPEFLASDALVSPVLRLSISSFSRNVTFTTSSVFYHS